MRGWTPSVAGCPQILRMACVDGYHYETISSYYDSNGCLIQNMQCVPDTTTATGNFSASPTSGQAPLAVSFSYAGLAAGSRRDEHELLVPRRRREGK